MSGEQDTIDPAVWEARPLFADEFYVTTTDMIRLSFGENTGDAARYHTAVVMTRDTAMELRDLLVKLLAEQQ